MYKIFYCISIEIYVPYCISLHAIFFICACGKNRVNVDRLTFSYPKDVTPVCRLCIQRDF